jgi:hypothetical protein
VKSVRIRLFRRLRICSPYMGKPSAASVDGRSGAQYGRQVVFPKKFFIGLSDLIGRFLGPMRIRLMCFGQALWSPIEWFTLYTSPRRPFGFDFCLGFCHDFCHTFLIGPGPLAQSVEQRTFNPWVVGSIPTGPTRVKSQRMN